MEAQTQVEFPPELDSYVNEKLGKNSQGGRPHFLKELAKDYPDVRNELLNIVEKAWIKNQPLGNIAHPYKTKYHTIFRLLKELEPFKATLTAFLLAAPRRRRWYIPELDQSDYETVQAYIKHAHSAELKKYREVIRDGRKFWVALNYQDPGRWTQEDVDNVLLTYQDRPGQQYALVTAVRALCPQLKATMKVGKYFDKIGRHKWDIFGKEVNMIHEALNKFGMTYHQTIFDFHISIGAREGKRGKSSGLCGITWDRFKENFTRVDDFESKVRRGIMWRDCPVDLFFMDLPQRLKALWIQRKKPQTGTIILRGYGELCRIYKEIRNALNKYYQGKIDPSILKELTTIHPHTADKIHVNLLWEAGIPLEIVAGQYEGHGEGIGLVGRGWLNIETIRKYYLSLTRKSERFQKLRNQIKNYSTGFCVNGRGSGVFPVAPAPDLHELPMGYAVKRGH